MTRPKPPQAPRQPRRTVRVKPSSYQPTKAELEKEIHIDATPEELARAIVTPVNVVHDGD